MRDKNRIPIFMQKFRDKKQLIGTTLGAMCFMPSFFISCLFGIIKNIPMGMLIMIITQMLWLNSIHLCVCSLENENRILKEKIKEKAKNNE